MVLRVNRFRRALSVRLVLSILCVSFLVITWMFEVVWMPLLTKATPSLKNRVDLAIERGVR